MAITTPIFSIENNVTVYHNNSDCVERNNIESKHQRAGTGNLHLCEHCRKLNIIDNWKKIIIQTGLQIPDIMQARVVV